jgi:hypothetical protein
MHGEKSLDQSAVSSFPISDAKNLGVNRQCQPVDSVGVFKLTLTVTATISM